MTNLELFAKGRKLEQAGWTWEIWSGSVSKGTAKGWWFLKDAEAGDVRGMRRGDPRSYISATTTTHDLYVKNS